MHKKTSQVLAVLLLAVTSAHAATPKVVFDPPGHAQTVSSTVEFLPRPTVGSKQVRRDRAVVTVDAQGVGQQPALQVGAGDVVSVRQVGGSWTVDQRSIPPVGAAGHLTETALHRDWGHRREVATLPFGRLLLRVGGGAWVDALGAPALRMRVGGPLELRINDDGGSLADNAGALEVEVLVERRGAAVKAGGCDAVKMEFQTRLDGLDVACQADAECGLLPGFNPCSQQVAARSVGSNPPHVAMDPLRRQAWEVCGFVPPPCALAPANARCEQRRCVVAAPDMMPSPAPPRPAAGCAGMDCGPGQRCVMQQVQCVRAPCPPMPMCVPQ